MLNRQEKEMMKKCVEIMWECYQNVARTPKDDEETRWFIKARDIHQAITNGKQDE